MTYIYSPLRYPGGKNRIFPFMSQVFQENELLRHSYAEPYAGGAGLALRLLFEEYTQHIFINDFDPMIFAFWSSVVEQTEEFCRWIEQTPVSIDTWRKCKGIIQDPTNHSSFELGTATFFLNRTNVSGIIVGGVIGGLSQGGKYKIDARYNRDSLIARIRKIGRFRDRITLTNMDGIEFIQMLDRGKTDVFIYLDPPYYEKGSKLYMNFYIEDDHSKLARCVGELKNPWLMSYDDHQFIVDRYDKYRKVSYQTSQSTSNKVGSEIFIFPDSLKTDASIGFLRGVTPIERRSQTERDLVTA